MSPLSGRVGNSRVRFLKLPTALVQRSSPSLDPNSICSIPSASRGHSTGLQADIVVNAAAYTAVDRAQSDEAMAYAINALGAELVAKACANRGLPVIHVSTDYVFDGMSSAPYRESDLPRPLSVYGKSKYEGEQRVAVACPQHIILRTAWLHSPFGDNFVKTMLRLAQSRAHVSVVADQYGNPTYAPHLAQAIFAIASAVVEPTELGSSGACTTPPEPARHRATSSLLRYFASHGRSAARLPMFLRLPPPTTRPRHRDRSILALTGASSPTRSAYDCPTGRSAYRSASSGY